MTWMMRWQARSRSACRLPHARHLVRASSCGAPRPCWHVLRARELSHTRPRLKPGSPALLPVQAELSGMRAGTFPAASGAFPTCPWQRGRPGTCLPGPGSGGWKYSGHSLSLRTSSAPCPAGDIMTPLGAPARAAFAVGIVEGWRGSICHAALTNSTGRFARYKIVDPSFRNWFGLALAMRGQACPIFRCATRASTCPTAGTTCEGVRNASNHQGKASPGVPHHPLPPGGAPRPSRALRGLAGDRPAPLREGDCSAAIEVCPTGAVYESGAR